MHLILTEKPREVQQQTRHSAEQEMMQGISDFYKEGELKMVLKTFFRTKFIKFRPPSGENLLSCLTALDLTLFGIDATTRVWWRKLRWRGYVCF